VYIPDGQLESTACIVELHVADATGGGFSAGPVETRRGEELWKIQGPGGGALDGVPVPIDTQVRPARDWRKDRRTHPGTSKADCERGRSYRGGAATGLTLDDSTG